VDLSNNYYNGGRKDRANASKLNKKQRTEGGVFQADIREIVQNTGSPNLNQRDFLVKFMGEK